MSYIYSSAVRQNSPPEWYCFLRSWGCTPAGLLDGWRSAWSFDLMIPAGHWKGWKKNKKIRGEHVPACFTLSCKNPRSTLNSAETSPGTMLSLLSFLLLKARKHAENDQGANLLTPSLLGWPKCLRPHANSTEFGRQNQLPFPLHLVVF